MVIGYENGQQGEPHEMQQGAIGSLGEKKFLKANMDSYKQRARERALSEVSL